MATVKDFILGARPKTLSAAISPVAIGAALATAIGPEQLYYPAVVGAPRESPYSQASWPVTIACLIVALALQVGVNYANDYSDGIKGTDENRVGPMRLVGSGRASPRSVLIAMCISFLIAAIAGIYVASQSSWWLVAVGALCITLAWFYTGSKHPYGYYGLGELVVFICFGLVATVGTYYANTLAITTEVIVASFIPGLFSVAILLANNIRDIEGDRASGKKTLAVRIGEKKSRVAFVLCFVGIGASIIILSFSLPLVLITLFTGIAWVMLVKAIFHAKSASDYILVLAATSRTHLIVAFVLVVAILTSDTPDKIDCILFC